MAPAKNTAAKKAPAKKKASGTKAPAKKKAPATKAAAKTAAAKKSPAKKKAAAKKAPAKKKSPARKAAAAPSPAGAPPAGAAAPVQQQVAATVTSWNPASGKGTVKVDEVDAELPFDVMSTDILNKGYVDFHVGQQVNAVVPKDHSRLESLEAL